MKKALYAVGILALASLAFASCQKQLDPNDENTPGGKLVTVTFVAQNPDTKTGILNEGESSVSYKWTSNWDNVKLYTVSDSGLTLVSGTTLGFAEDGSLLTITATVPEGSTVRALLSGWINTAGTAFQSASSQKPLFDSFDPTADVLISDDEVVVAGITEFSLVFHRKVTVNKMTLHGLHPGEIVQEVVVSSLDETKNLVGTSPLAWNGWEGQRTPINIGYTANHEAVQEGNDYIFPVYFTTIPVEDVPLHLTVYTDQYVYEKDLNGSISFSLGQFTKFNVGLPEGTPPVADQYTWFLAEGDLGSTLNVYQPRDKGNPGLDWYSVWMGSSNPANFGWDPDKGIRVGSDDVPCKMYMLTTTYYVGYIESVRVNVSCDNPDGFNLQIYAGISSETNLVCGEATFISGTTNAAYYTFTCPAGILRGGIRLHINNTSGPFYIKSIEFNPTYSRGTAGQDDTVNAYNTGF